MASVFAPVVDILLAGREHADRNGRNDTALADALSAALTDAAASKGEDQGQQATDELKVVDSLAAVLQCSRWASIEYAFP